MKPLSSSLGQLIFNWAMRDNGMEDSMRVSGLAINVKETERVDGR